MIDHKGGKKAKDQNEQKVDSQRKGVAQFKAAKESGELAPTQLKKLADNYLDQKQPIQKKANLESKPKGNNTGLPEKLKSGIENISGHSMDDVHVHYNSDKPAQLQAHAYAQGNQIHLAPGQEKHLPHEAWHVVQQKQDRVKPTTSLNENVHINDDAGLEKEADVMGAKAQRLGKENKAFEIRGDHTENSQHYSTVQRVQLIDPKAPKNEQVIQPKITIGSTVYNKKGSNATKALVERLKNTYGGTNWKRGWIKYLTESAGNYQEIPEGPFSNDQELADAIENKFPPSQKGSVEAQFLFDAFNESDLSLTGFIWKVLKNGVILNDGRVFTKADLLKAMSKSDGKKLIGDHWRDTNNAVHGGQLIQGKHEWILTSNLIYVIENAKSLKDLEIWFMAAEMLRSPTQNVIFDFDLSQSEVNALVNDGVKLSELQKLGAHPGALYEERGSNDEKKLDPKKHNKQAVQGSSKFHDRLESLLKTYLNPQKSDISGYLQGLLDFHKKEIWSGTINGYTPDDFQNVETGFYTGTKIDSQKKDQDMKAFMLRQQQNYQNDRMILRNQIQAILSELNSIESSNTLAVDVKKLKELDEDSKYDVEVYFEEIDDQFNIESKKLAQFYQMKINKSPNQFEAINSEYKQKWRELYDQYIHEKSSYLEKTYNDVMKIS